jgi:fatty acid desaturase
VFPCCRSHHSTEAVWSNLRRSLAGAAELRARIAALKNEMQLVRRDVREIRDALLTVRGGWKALAFIATISASPGAVISKACAFPALGAALTGSSSLHGIRLSFSDNPRARRRRNAK